MGLMDGDLTINEARCVVQAFLPIVLWGLRKHDSPIGRALRRE